MYIDIVPNRSSPPAYLLRESYRDGGKVRKRTLANLSSLPPEQIELLRAVLRGDRLVPADHALEIVRARPDGHVQAVWGRCAAAVSTGCCRMARSGCAGWRKR
jgi:hypothetical protein